MDGKYVFISYSSKDFEQATWIKNTLESNGIPCWMDKKSIHGGQDFSKEIPEAIKGCSAFVLILTRNSQEAHWVQEEILAARDGKKRILPFVLDAETLNGSIPFGFRTIQMYNATEKPEKEIENLIRDIKEEFNAPAEKVKIRKKMPKSKNNGEKKKMKLWKKLVIGFIILIALTSCLELLADKLISYTEGDTTQSDIKSDIVNDTTKNSLQGLLNNNEEETSDSVEGILNNLTFELDGVTYSLPCDFSELYANGWEPQTYNSINETIYRSSNILIRKNDSFVYIVAYTSEPCELINSKVGCISYEPDCNVSFSVNGKIKPGSHYDELVAEFGTPEKLGRDDIDMGLDYDEFGYIYDYERRISFKFYKDTSRCYEIELKNFIYEKEY